MRILSLLALTVSAFVLIAPVWSQLQSAYPAAVAHVQQGRFNAAISLLEKLLIQTPSDLKARNLLGIALMSAGRRADANVQFKKALELNPNFAPALKNLGLNELAMGHSKDAKAHFEQAEKVVPRDAVVQFQLGKVYFLERRYVSAAVHFAAALEGFPDRYQAGFNLTLAYVSAEDYAAAIRAGEQLLARGEHRAELYNLLSRAYSHSSRIQDAYDALRAATRIDPADETNYLDLMALCLDHENWDLSLEISEVALEKIPQSYKVRLQRGSIFALKGQLEKAEAEFLAATKAAPKVNMPYVTLALVRIEEGKVDEAVAGLRARRAVAPKDYLVNWILGEALIQQGAEPGTAAENDAVQALETASRANPTAAPPRALLAGLLAKRGNRERAMQEFEAVLKIDPDDASSAYQLAVLYQQTGATKRAEELFAKVAKARAQDPATRAPRNLVKIIREGSQ